MQGYGEYAASQAEWLGALPSHWECKKIGSLFTERKTKVSDKDYSPLSVTKMGILPQLEHAAKSNDGDNRKLVCAGDFVINSRSDRKGSCGVSELDGSVSLINLILTPRGQWNNRYAHYLLGSQLFSEEYYRNGRGIVADLWTTRYSEMKSILLPVPPRDEQDQIVRFLDWKVSSINKLISIKWRQIEELRSLKTFYISKAVTNGVDDNGIIADASIGLSWSRVKIGYKSWIRARLGWRGLKATEYVDEGYPFLSAFNIVNDKLSWQNLNFINQYRYDESPEIKLSIGDILLVKDGAGIGKCARIDDLPYGESTPNGSLAVITPNDDLSYRYLYYYLVSNDFKDATNRIITGMGVPHLTQHFLKNVEVPCPPFDMQEKVAAFLDTKCEKLNAMIAIKETEIDELKELRMRLIADVVTGKIDVRGIEIPEYKFLDEDADGDAEDADGEEDTEEQED